MQQILGRVLGRVRWLQMPTRHFQEVLTCRELDKTPSDHASQITFSYTHFLIKPLYSFHQSITCFRPCMAVQNSSDSSTHAHENMQIWSSLSYPYPYTFIFFPPYPCLCPTCLLSSLPFAIFHCPSTCSYPAFYYTCHKAHFPTL